MYVCFVSAIDFDFVGVQLYMPSSGFINNCDGGRSHTYCDYRQQ
jgi:hypothetical protein